MFVRRPTPRATRARIRFVVLLVVVAGVLGVGAMHTLGHVSEAQHHTAPVAAAVDTHHASGDATGAPLPTFDPTTMCLAVGGFVLALVALLVPRLPRWPDRVPLPPRWLGQSVLARAPRPHRSTLAQLQVMRV
ncbi:DUF6153 family protein [Lipingzhangella sp. LS1_29]|uniref:DUF6153 family protein n=1 Tax=Lipingzhangella rawalii TaxID=2055835 RepID=A0ABU2HA16_9ACTN|nr:DUF6153 family protein [Lipingzhangella rawalii]